MRQNSDQGEGGSWGVKNQDQAESSYEASSAEDESGDPISDDEAGDSGEDEDQSTVRIPDDVIERQVKEFLVEAKKVGNDERSQENLFSSYKKYLFCRTGSNALANKNVLYKIVVEENKAANPPEAWVVKRLASEDHRLLSDKDEFNEEYALLRAIQRNMDWFVQNVLSSKISDENLKSILDPTRDPGNVRAKNCIHVAIKHGLQVSLTVSLIEKASEFTLVAADENGLTPLHLAVHYSRCRREQMEVINALLKHGDGALDRTSGDLSVYRYHRQTRKANEQNADKTKQAKGQPGQDKQRYKSSGSLARGRKKTETPATRKSEAELQAREEQWEEKKQKQEMRDDGNRAFALRRRPTGIADAIVNTVSREPSQSNQANSKRHLAESNRTAPDKPSTDGKAEKHSDKKKRSANQTKPRSKPSSASTLKSERDEWADQIAMQLKLHYLRTTFRFNTEHNAKKSRNYTSAERFLYGDNHERKALCFSFPPNLSGTPVTVKIENFKAGYNHISFDPVLLYVEFGQVKVDRPEGRPPKVIPGRGKDDLGIILDWLSGKNVRRIIKLAVDDMADPPHSDETIIKSLSKFNIENLQWRKIDLCPFVIREASKNWSDFQEIHLWWSGSNAVLRGWSEPEGLPALRTLKCIHLYEVTASLDSRTYIQSRMEDFKARLDANRNQEWDRINVQHISKDEPSHGHGNRTANPQIAKNLTKGQDINGHQWLNVMDQFIARVRDLSNRELPGGFPEDYLTSLTLPGLLAKKVTVALIDDGAHFFHPAISGCLGGGRSFSSVYREYDGIGAPEPYHGSTTGHGTTMACLISRMCPEVEIFVCKMDISGKAENGKPDFTAKSAADAVEYAVKQGYDVISISWTIKLNTEENGSNTKDLSRLRDSLNEAAKKNTLVFCSAPDIGHARGKNSYYPFDCKELHNVFRVGAACVYGTRTNYTGSDVDFILPGENVSPRDVDKAVAGIDECPKSGSSVATALAAGLAALIIHCVRMAGIYSVWMKKERTGVTHKTLQVIKQYEVMKKAFQIINSADPSTKKEQRIGVESFFVDWTRRLANGSSWEIMEKLARDLVSDNMENEWIKKLEL
ncbi:hypothetical protein BDV28DRAFT_145429 [Aspergillus coremiiformis]|uniref:Peptidase S8/S53 domain-containing protein n=1 Tax=Aspergillus coremiiformis TaxID=138285 RepID=A0A5N6ZFI5_9EURO|nr:hypothetical protein BDV28DRAFT_145429 [Aspergillus coremiiformis]